MIIDEELSSMVELASAQFREAGKNFCTVESCTGGLIATAFTARAGSSQIFERGFVTYSDQAKIDCVHVDEKTLEAFGAVSMQCAIEMAVGGLKASSANACVSITGIAGPTGATEEKELGLVFIAVANDFEPGAYGEEFNFGNIGRNKVQLQSAKAAVEMLLAYGLEIVEH